MKMTPARFIESYARLGVLFELRNGVVVASGAGVSPVFAQWVAQNSDWLRGAMGAQAQNVSRETLPTVAVKSTPADRLIWQGIQNARKHEAKVKAIQERYK